MTDFLTHGRILGGVVATPDLDLAVTDYAKGLGLTIVESGQVGAELATSWGCPGNAASRMATLQPHSGAHCFIRLVEQSVPKDFIPTRTFGWASYELTVQDVYGWPNRLSASGFEIVGQPREIEGLPYFVAMQMIGRGREMLYLNEVRMDTPSSDLPRALCPVDHIFIAILATPDRAATSAWYRDRLGLDEGGIYEIEYTMINAAFGLPSGTISALSMVQAGRLPILEVDDYPATATVRAGNERCLPPGNALLSLAVDSLDKLDLEWIMPPASCQDALYGGRRAATVRGPAGELLELIEIG
jgi:catechol 2,3-dioxygenase-like lactoylglutathione lyase family enzyme